MKISGCVDEDSKRERLGIEPFHIQVWLNADGSIEDSLGTRGMQGWQTDYFAYAETDSPAMVEVIDA